MAAEDLTIKEKAERLRSALEANKERYHRVAMEQAELNTQIVAMQGALGAYEDVLRAEQAAERRAQKASVAQAAAEAAAERAEKAENLAVEARDRAAKVAAEEQSGSAGGKTWPPEQ